MQAVIVAAGRGTRLGGLGRRIPKCLLRVDEEPLLRHQILALRAAGVQRATVVVGHLGESVSRFLVSERWGIEVRSVPNPAYADTGGGASFVCGTEDLDDDVLYLIGDMLYEPSLIPRIAAPGGRIVLGVQLRPTAPEDMKIRLAESRVAEIGKHLRPDRADGEFLGAAFIPRTHLAELRCAFAGVIDESAKRSGHFGDLMQAYIAGGHEVGWADCSDLFWCEIDSVSDLRKARLRWIGVKS